jgi:ATP:ADP antiporter, AAA family
MSRQEIDCPTSAEKTSYSLFYRFLRLFTDIRQGEASKALLLALNSFLLLMAYYILKPLRDALLLVDKDSPVVKSYLSGAQAILFIFVIKGFSRLSSRVPRHILITWTTLFFISNIVIFYFLNLGGMSIKTMGIIFFIWIGVFNYFVVAQFWGFANDLYSSEVGKRVFPLIALGATSGAVVGTRMKWLRDLVGESWEYKLMLISGIILLICIGLSVLIHKREVRMSNRDEEKKLSDTPEKTNIQEQPLKAGGGFRLVFKSRYLLYIALMIGILNFVNATGEYIISDVQTRASLQAVQTVGADMQKSIHSAFMDYQFLTSVIALVIQLFFVSRIFRWVGVSGALLFLPFIALGGYALISFGATLVLVRWVKSLENGTDYSLQSTTKAALFLITPREEKYKAKVAIDTFFVRGGDTLSALTVLAGTQLLSATIEKYAFINVVGVGIWLAICVLVMKEYKKRKAKSAENLASL